MVIHKIISDQAPMAKQNQAERRVCVGGARTKSHFTHTVILCLLGLQNSGPNRALEPWRSLMRDVIPESPQRSHLRERKRTNIPHM